MMSADTTAGNVESSSENLAKKETDKADNDNNQQNVGQQNFGSRGPHNFGGGGGGGGGHQNFGNRRGGGPRFGNRRFNQQQQQQHDSDETRKPRFQRGGPNQQGGPGEHRSLAERIMYDRLNEISGPSYELPILDSKERKFSSRCRLYVGNLPNDVDETELSNMFKQFGETAELFVNKEKSFAFIKLDYHFNADKAKNELNGKVVKGRNLKIRFAPNSAAIKIKNLDEYVTNELLHTAFSIFGEIERCVVIVDERGKSVSEGVVEFARKSSAQLALRKCSENCFYLTGHVQPVFVEQHESLDETDGYSEKFLKKNQDFFKYRNIGPRFAPPNSFEDEYGMRWKQLYELYEQKLEALKKEHKIQKEKLMAQMEYARYEHETAMLREQLRARELDMNRQKREWELKEQEVDEIRRRQQENTLFLQAQQLDTMLDSQEQSYEKRESTNTDEEASGSGETKTFMHTFERGSYNNREMGGGQRGGYGGRGYWANENREFPEKRRRY